MSQDSVVSVVQYCLYTLILVSAPPLVLGLVVGVAVSIFQTVTSIQEPTLAFVPKILAVLLAIIIFGPWMLTTLMEFFQTLMDQLPELL